MRTFIACAIVAALTALAPGQFRPSTRTAPPPRPPTYVRPFYSRPAPSRPAQSAPAQGPFRSAPARAAAEPQKDMRTFTITCRGENPTDSFVGAVRQGIEQAVDAALPEASSRPRIVRQTLIRRIIEQGPQQEVLRSEQVDVGWETVAKVTVDLAPIRLDEPPLSATLREAGLPRVRVQVAGASEAEAKIVISRVERQLAEEGFVIVGSGAAFKSAPAPASASAPASGPFRPAVSPMGETADLVVNVAVEQGAAPDGTPVLWGTPQVGLDTSSGRRLDTARQHVESCIASADKRQTALADLGDKSAQWALAACIDQWQTVVGASEYTLTFANINELIGIVMVGEIRRAPGVTKLFSKTYDAQNHTATYRFLCRKTPRELADGLIDQHVKCEIKDRLIALTRIDAPGGG